jgi:threonine synthase
MRVFCPDCESEAEFSVDQWRCGCGGAWEPADKDPFDISKIEQDDYSIWRYGKMLGLDCVRPIKRMGVGWTPLVPIDFNDRRVHLKLEYLSPSGSFKDRGVNPMINQMVSMGVKMVIEDSSGNAGASLAAHSARFGLRTKIFVPAYASKEKLSQISIYGAEVIPIKGPRKAAEDAAMARIDQDWVYTSHAYNPAYLAGQMTAAWEIWEQLGKKAPDWVLCPVAQGGQFLGLWFGFRRLLDSGLIEQLPKMVAVQAANIAPIYQAWKNDLAKIPFVEARTSTVAEGVAISKPVRGKRILQALKETRGYVLAIEEKAIIDAQDEISHMGYYIEPTSALAIAGLHQLLPEIKDLETIVIPLTGNGLKGKPRYKQKHK